MTELRRGRMARKRERAGGAGANTSAIWPGIEGGRYQPLTPAEVQMMDQTASYP